MFDFLIPYYGYGSDFLALVLGVVFVVHGWPKLTNPSGIAGVWGGSRIAGRLHGVVEVAAAIAVALDFYRDWGLAVMVVIMLGAIFFKALKWKMPFKAERTAGWEFDLLILAGALALLLG